MGIHSLCIQKNISELEGHTILKIQTKMILVEEEYRTRPEGPEGNEGIRESHVDVNYDITAQNSSIISQGNQTQRINEI